MATGDVSELLWRPALELAALVRAGEVSSRELVAASLERIEALDGRVGAFTVLDAERALDAAEAVAPGDARPFAGVPLAVKDLFAAVAGMRQSNGSSFAESVPTRDTAAVRRLKDAGFVIVGGTKSPELGILPVTEPRRFGPARNPWDLERTPGGSSGGSGAAVAAGMVPIAHGSDGGGSLRIPAACCGLVGLKPSRGRISHGPELGDSFLATDGVLTRTVADTAAALDVLAGYEPGDATWACPPREPFAAAATREPGRLRVALTLEPPFEMEVDPVQAAAAREAAELLASLGHEVVEATPPWRDPETFRVFTVLWAGLIGTSVGGLAARAGREPEPGELEPLSMELYRKGRETDAVAYLLAQARLQGLARRIVGFFAEHDVVLTPSLAQRPLPIGALDPCSADPWDDFRRSGQFMPFTAIVNVTGQPAIALPLQHGDDGLPLAVQLIGRPEDEATLLALGAQLEAARPWADRRPPLTAG
ncbi:MAG TPA: amidase [Baekduia sp.]|nr:amidase [Baekduia sp.]